MKCKKLMIVTNIPNQYRVPLFNTLQNQLDSIGIKLLVVFGAQSLHSRKSVVNLDDVEFNYQLLSRSSSSRKFIIYKGLSRLILKEKPDAIIVGGFSMPSIKVALLRQFKLFQFIVWTGSFETQRNIVPNFKKIIRKWLFNKAEYWLAYSHSTKKYLTKNGVKENRLVVVGNTVDTQFFSEKTDFLRKNEIQTNKKTLTYIGYLNQRKGVDKIIKLAKELSKLRNDFCLQIIGDGPERENLEQYTRKLNLQNYVRFEGFKQKEELPIYLAKSNAFLFQTTFDIWGLVLNEAMAAKVLCFASIYAGATKDLIKDGVNGYVVDFENAEETAIKINEALQNEIRTNKLAAEGAITIQSSFSLEKCANRMISILK